MTLYLANVLVFAFPLALFEIWLERFKSGWGGEFYSPFWGKKLKILFVGKVAEKAYITPYHLAMFGVVMPGLFTAEYFVLRHVAGQGGWVISLSGTQIVPIMFLPAVWLGVATLEDFLWFALNWRYRDALRRLFRGEMSWHTNWVHVTSSVMVPRFYLTAPVLVFFLLLGQHLLGRLGQ